MQPTISVPNPILNPSDSAAKQRVQHLTALLRYTWGSRLVQAGGGNESAYLAAPDSLSVAAVGDRLEIVRVITWRRLDRGDVLHAVKVVLCALAPDMEYRVTPMAHADWEVAFEAAVLQSGLLLPAGTYGLPQADAVAELSLDPGKASLLEANVPLSLLLG